MGLNVWAATGDRGKDWLGNRFDSIPNCLADLPLTFDDATNRIVRNIDVLWLEGNSIQAAFEIESTTSVYSGLLRMSDLLSMQPNLNIPLFIVAPDDRRGKVIAEINHATFLRLKPRLVDICRYIRTLTPRVTRPHGARSLLHASSISPSGLRPGNQRVVRTRRLMSDSKPTADDDNDSRCRVRSRPRTLSRLGDPSRQAWAASK